MSQNIFQAITQGPKEEKTAKTVVKITTFLLVFSAVFTLIFSVAGFFQTSETELIQYLLDPYAMIDVVLMFVLAFFIYKLHLWAAITLIIYQLLSSYVIYSETAHFPSAVVALKLLLFISTCRGIYLLNKQAKELKASNA